MRERERLTRPTGLFLALRYATPEFLRCFLLFCLHSSGVLFLFLLGVFSAVDAEEVGITALDAEELGVTALDAEELGVSALDDGGAGISDLDDGGAGISDLDDRYADASDTDSGDAGVPAVAVDSGEATELELSIFASISYVAPACLSLFQRARVHVLESDWSIAG